MIWIFIFFISFHFSYIEIHKRPIRQLLAWFLLLSGIEILLLWLNNIQILLAIVVLNIWIVALALFLQSSSRNTIKFNWRSYFVSGWYIFTVFMTIAFSLTLFWVFPKFPYSCQDISNGTSKVIDIVTKPFEAWIDEVNHVKNKTKNFFNYTIHDVLKIWQKTEIKSANPNSIIKKLDKYKDKFIDKTLTENNTVNMWVCDYLLKELNLRYVKTWFQVSVIAIMFLLLYPFVRIMFWVMSAIAFLLFELLYLLRIYKKWKHQVDVEHIE